MTFDWFDHITVINHPMTHRRKEIVAKLSALSVTADKIVYADRPMLGFAMNNMRRNARNEFGCNLSQIKAVVGSIGYERPLFLEDDVCFQNLHALESALKELPDDWNVLYLGGHPCGPADQVGDYLYKIQRFSFAEAYAINGSSILKFFDYWCNRIGQPSAMYDRILGEFAQENTSYAIYPTVTYQPDGYSFIAGREDEKLHCVEKGWRENLFTR